MKNFFYAILAAVIITLPMFVTSCSDMPGEMRSPQTLRISDDQELIIEDANLVEIGNYGIRLTDTTNQTTDGLYTADSLYILPTSSIDETDNTDYYTYASGIVGIINEGTYLVNLCVKGSSTGTAAIVDVQNGVNGTWSDIEESRVYVADTLDVQCKSFVYDFADADSVRLTKATATSGTATLYELGTKVEIVKLK